MNNEVNLSGCITSDFRYSHEVYSEKFYSVMLSVKRNSSVIDLIPLLVSEKIIDVHKSLIGSYVYIKGGFRSYNQHDVDKNRVKLYVFVDSMEMVTNDKYINDVFLEGFICKTPTYRHTPLGREVSDVTLAVNRAYNKSDYIPCILWGRNAYAVRSLDAGERIRVSGRIQSREYNKHGEVKTAYELSVNLMELC